MLTSIIRPRQALSAIRSANRQPIDGLDHYYRIASFGSNGGLAFSIDAVC
jgi:hypothetical protein